MSKYVRKKHPKNCIICDEIFYASNRGKITRKYCSSKCRYSSSRVVLSCETCNTTVVRTKGSIRNKVYCSKECSDIGKIGVPINTVNKVSITCCNCKSPFEVLPCFENRKFCSRKCADIYKHMSIPKVSMRNLWERQRLRALDRDDNRCVTCNMDNDTHIDVYGKGLNVHHIVPHHYYREDNEEQHSLSNLMTVCTRCHHDIHRDELKPTEYDVSMYRSI